jgi:flagellar basal-body rod protein FlgB
MSSTFGGLSTAINALMAQRQALDVAGQNIANVNTPGYRRQEVDFESALQAAWDQGSSSVERVTPSVETDTSSVMRADGSSVDIDTEAAEQAKNGLQYETVSSVMKTRIAILKSAMGTV